MEIRLRISPDDKQFYSQLERVIQDVLETPLSLEELCLAVNSRATEYKLKYSDLSPPEIASVARNLYAQRKVEYTKGKYALNRRGCL